MIRFIILSLFLLLSLFANEKVSLQLKWKDSFQFAGFYMAKEKGFYKKAGLDVTLKELDSKTNLVDSVLDGKATYGVGDSALIYYRLQNKPIVLMMPIFESTPLALLTTKNVKSLQDFKSKKLMINEFSLNSPAILSMLYLSNIDMKRFNPKSGVFSVEDMLKQNLDLYSVYIPNQPYYLKKHHIKYHLFTPKEYGLDFYGDMLFTSEKEINNHFNRAVAFMDASKKGWEYAFSHLNETIDVIEKKYNSQHFSKDELLYQAKEYQKLVSQTFKFNKQKIENTKIIFKLFYKTKNNFKYEDFVLNRYVATKKEREFLKTHKIRCVTTTTWAPFNLIKDGKIEGLALDYWNIVADKLGMDNSCKQVNDFTKLLNLIKSKKADLTISTSETADRKKYAVFSKEYVKFPIVIVTKKGIGFISGIDNIKNKTIAVAKNYTATKLIKAKYPNLHYIETDNLSQSLNLVKNSQAYATIGILPAIAYKINKENFDTLKIAGKTEFEFPVKFMVRKDYKELIPMINRVIDSIDEDTKERIYNRWISVNMQNGYSKNRVNRLILLAVVVFAIFLLWILVLVYHIQKRKKAELALERLANYDELTSIYNRHKIDEFLSEQMEIAKRYQRSLSLIFFDIDKFKSINDTFGHKAGDKVLQEIAQVVSKNIRESDGFGRWGGEEFLIALPETDLVGASQLAEKLRREIENHNFPVERKVTCSFGVIEVESETNLDKAIKRVDELLYKAKETGRNKVVAK